MRLVFAVHGIGPQLPGTIRDRLTESLQTGGIEAPVEEFNWSTVAPAPQRGAALAVELIGEVLWAVTNSAFTESRCAAARPTGWAGLSTALTDWARLVCFAGLASVPVALCVILAVFVPLESPATSNELAGEAVGAYWRALAWAGAAALALAGASCLVDVGRALGARRRAPLTAALRRNGLAFLPVPAALLALPFAIPWAKHRNQLLATVVMMVVLMGLIVFGFAAIEYAYHKPGQRLRTVEGLLDGLRVLGAFLAVGTVAISALALAAAAVVPALVRLALDVLRYTGGPAHRRAVQERLAGQFAAATSGLGPGDTVYLLGHSLGSVICLDFLLNTLTPGGYRLVLVTGGSPITRFFRRFFPGLYFPEDLGETVHLLRHRFGDRFRWLNVYRPRDPVGTALGFPAGLPAADLSTGQRLFWWSAHLNYWGDAGALAPVVRWLGADEAPPAAPVPPAADRHYCPDHDFSSRPHRALITAALYCGPFLALGCGLWAAGWGCYYAIADGRRTVQTEEELVSAGTRTSATVVHRRVLINPPSEHAEAVYDDVYEVSFPDAGGAPRREEFRVRNDTSGIGTLAYFNDFDRLRDAVRERGEMIDPDDSPLKLDLYLKRRLVGVPVAYLPDRPGTILFTDYHRTHSALGRTWRYATASGGAVLVGCMLGVLIVGIGGAALMLFATAAGETFDSDSPAGA